MTVMDFWFPVFDDIHRVPLRECAPPEAREAACTRIPTAASIEFNVKL